MQFSVAKICNFMQNKDNLGLQSYKNFLHISPNPLWKSDELLVLQALRSTCEQDLKSTERHSKLTLDTKSWCRDWFDPLATGIRSYRRAGVNPLLKSINSTRRLYISAHWGHMPLLETHCKSSIKKNKCPNLSHILASKLNDGYPAYSVFLPLFHTYLGSSPVTISEILDLTGVPYQARLHSIALGYPILGDPNANNKLFERYLFNDVCQPIEQYDFLHLHCWKAEFLIEQEKELNKIYVQSPDLLLPTLGHCSRDETSSDSLLSKPNKNQLYYEGKSSSFVEHKGFFHHVDPSNIEKIYPRLVGQASHKHQNDYDFEGATDQRNHVSKIQNSFIKSEMCMNYPQRIHQKFHDNQTPYDSTKS